MDFISSAVLGGILYDLIKNGTVLTKELLRQKLSDWLIDDAVAERLIEQSGYLPVPDTTSEVDIVQHIENSPTWQSILKEIKPVVQHNEGITIESMSGGSATGKKEVHGDYIETHNYHSTPEPKTPKKP